MWLLHCYIVFCPTRSYKKLNPKILEKVTHIWSVTRCILPLRDQRNTKLSTEGKCVNWQEVKWIQVRKQSPSRLLNNSFLGKTKLWKSMFKVAQLQHKRRQQETLGLKNYLLHTKPKYPFLRPRKEIGFSYVSRGLFRKSIIFTTNHSLCLKDR